VLFQSARPVILNGIEDVITGPDLADRAKQQATVCGPLPAVRLGRLPRMADFALWSTACETAFWRGGTFLRAYNANRTTAIESVVEADPVAARVREIMARRTKWAGNASDLMRVGADASGDYMSMMRSAGWPRSPRALAGRQRRAQTSLRMLCIEIAFWP
jgi:hypothetical protein